MNWETFFTALGSMIVLVTPCIVVIIRQIQQGQKDHAANDARLKALEQPDAITLPLLPGGILQNRGVGEMPQFTDQPKGNA